LETVNIIDFMKKSKSLYEMTAIKVQASLAKVTATGGKLTTSACHQVSISPTFYEQLLRQNPFTKKLQTQIVST
jgi:hypothetical protein